jgi:hemerythrin-like domain-containing protein
MGTRTSGAVAVRAFAEHEHHDLTRGINRIHAVACEIGHGPSLELSANVAGILHWLDSILEPHVAWEETWLYPEIDARTGTPWATKAARFDHYQIREMVGRLRADDFRLQMETYGDRYAEVRCHLFGLEALLRAHIEREERYLIPLLEDDLPPDRSDRAVALTVG